MKLEKLQKDMMEAMKAHDKARKESISVLYSAAKKLGIELLVLKKIKSFLKTFIIISKMEKVNL